MNFLQKFLEIEESFEIFDSNFHKNFFEKLNEYYVKSWRNFTENSKRSVWM